MDELNLNSEELEIDEQTLKKIARKYRIRTVAAIFTILAALIAIAISVFIFKCNLDIANMLGSAQDFERRGHYLGALTNYNASERIANKNNETIPVFRTGNKILFGKFRLYNAFYGPVACKNLIDGYYSENNYPEEVRVILNEEKIFSKAYDELNKFVFAEAADYGEAYEGIERISDENPEYPEYVILYFHLLATQKFKESPKAQLSAYTALSKEMPGATWLYAQAGTKALIKNNELSKALRLCPEDASDESRAMKISIHRLMGEYKEAGMLYDEYRIFGKPSELLDREMLIIHLMEGNIRTGIASMSYYIDDLDNCTDVRTLYTLQIAAIKANDKKLEQKVTSYIKSKNIPQSTDVLEYKTGAVKLADIFLNGESELN